MITGGRLGDLFGRRRLFVHGTLGFAITSLLCALAGSPGELVAARLAQGFAGALMIPWIALAPLVTGAGNGLMHPTILGIALRGVPAHNAGAGSSDPPLTIRAFETGAGPPERVRSPGSPAIAFGGGLESTLRRLAMRRVGSPARSLPTPLFAYRRLLGRRAVDQAHPELIRALYEGTRHRGSGRTISSFPGEELGGVAADPPRYRLSETELRAGALAGLIRGFILFRGDAALEVSGGAA